MTEEEARDKWCPMARDHGSNQQHIQENGGRTTQTLGHCHGANCMLWRWSSAQPTELGYPANTAVARVESKIHGYCGLAGQS